MSDTQWSNKNDAANNPGTVAVGIINQLNQQFIVHGVKFVLQVGDLDDQETNYSGLSGRIGISTRAGAAQALYDAGIGFFPVRGNHEGSSTAATEVQANFPQTQGNGLNTFGAANFSSPSSNLAGLSYSFDYYNARFVLLDQFTPTDGKASDGSTYNVGNNAISSQQPWIASALSSRPAGSHAFVFSHKQLFGGNHTDTLFNTAASNAAQQNAFISSLYLNNAGYLFTGHDHMHNYSIATSPDGSSKVRQIICASDSYKLYIPVSLCNHGTDTTGPNAGQISKNREMEISQELFSSGYYIVTVDGPRVTVDFYSADPTPAVAGLADVDLQTTPTLTFTKRETFGYSLNGQEYIVHQGQTYTAVNETHNGTTAAILSGTNGSANKDYNNRALVKAVYTGWAPIESGNASETLSLWGMAEGLSNSLPYESRNTTLTDTFVLSMSFDPAKASAADLFSGNFGLVAKDAKYGWVNAVSKNYRGAARFVIGPWAAEYSLGTYGVDTSANKAWAVINHNSDFAVGMMGAGNPLPAVELTSPVDNDAFDIPASITITANASDSNGTISKVEFYANGTKIGEDATAPHSYAWNAFSPGDYTLTAVAIDDEFGTTESAPIIVTVKPLPPGAFFEDFNSMGPSGATPPAGWSIKNANSGTSNTTWLTSIPESGANSVATMESASGALTATTTPTSTNNNGYNAAAAGITTDRMIATSPTSVAGAAIQLSATNSGGSAMNRLLIGYDIYRINATSSVNELPGYWLFYSLDNGTTWTNVSPLNPTLSGPAGVIVPNAIGKTNVAPAPVALSANWEIGNSILFRWVDDNGAPTSPDQMYGLDNVFIRSVVPLNVDATASGMVYNRATRTYNGTIRLANAGQNPIAGKFFVSLANLASGVTLLNASGSDNQSPYIGLTLSAPLNPGEFVSIPVSFNNPSNARISFSAIAYQ
jgi:hypothetical protein